MLELGADSLGLAKIVSDVKTVYGRQLDMATMFSFPSIEIVVKMAGKESQGNSSQGKEEVDGSLQRPASFSLLPNGKGCLETLCRQASVWMSDVEDAFPLSSSQKMYFDIFYSGHADTELMWQMNRYKLAGNTDKKRLIRALASLQRHEESLRWMLTEDPELGWTTLQLRPDVRNCVEEL